MKTKYLVIVSVLIFIIAPSCFGLVDTYKGKISLIGNMPLTKLILVTESQSKYVISGDNEILEELKNLQGAFISLNGRDTGKKSYGFPEINADYYQLLYIGEGDNKKTPWVGVLEKKDGQLLLITNTKSYFLFGPMISLLEDNLHAKVWVTGTLRRGWFWKPSIINVDAYQIIRK